MAFEQISSSAPPEINLVVYIDYLVSTKSKPSDFDAEIDLIERYEDMIELQVETLSAVDDKAAQATRLIALLLGLLLSVASYLTRADQTITVDTVPVFLFLAATVGSYVVALLLAILTYLSSSFEYGPSSHLGSFMAQYTIPDEEYVSAMLAGYSETVHRNKAVVVNNARRFQWCLSALLVGVVNTAGAAVLLLVGGSFHVDTAVLVVSTLVSGVTAWYVLQEEYLTIEREFLTNE